MNVVIDDRLLIEALLVGMDRRGASLHTTTCWYLRACRAAVAGAGGHLSGPFHAVPAPEQRRAIAAMLQLPEEVGLPELRRIVPLMAAVAGRHPRLNLLHLEAVAMAHSLGATMWLSPEGAAGALSEVLPAEGISFETVTPR